jgi:hypothetical protein
MTVSHQVHFSNKFGIHNGHIFFSTILIGNLPAVAITQKWPHRTYAGSYCFCMKILTIQPTPSPPPPSVLICQERCILCISENLDQVVPSYSLILCKSRETIDLIPIGTGDLALAYGVILVNLKLLGRRMST